MIELNDGNQIPQLGFGVFQKTGRTMMAALITTLGAGVPKPLQELITLGRTLKKRATDVLAYFDRPAPPTAPPRRSTAASNICAAQPWDFATSPTTSPDHYWKPADSNPNYTLNYEEPVRLATPGATYAANSPHTPPIPPTHHGSGYPERVETIIFEMQATGDN